MQDSSMHAVATEAESINKLLLKCIDLRNQINLFDSDSLQKFYDQETVLKHKLLEKYYKLSSQQRDPTVEIELYIERTSQPCQEPIYFLCNPKWSIFTAKRKIIHKVQLDTLPENMLVICQSKIAKSWCTLEECGVEKDGDMLYVYIAQSDTSNLASESSNELNSDEISLGKLMKQLDLCNVQTLKTPFESKEVLLENTPSIVKSTGERSLFPAFNRTASNASSNLFPSDMVSKIDYTTSDTKTDISISTKAIVFNDYNFSATSNNSMRTSSLVNTVAKFVSLPQTENTVLPQFNAAVKTLPIVRPQIKTVAKPTFGWVCTVCTYVNQPTRPGCEMCSNPRPEDYKLPTDYNPTEDERELIKKQKYSDEMFKKMRDSEEENRQQAYQGYVSAQQQTLLENEETVECSICISDAEPGEAVKLSECLHSFCKECLSMHINLSDQLPVKCPYVDDNYDCTSLILDREIRSLLPDDQYQSYLRKSLSAAEKHVKNSFHCKTPDCFGWCEYDDGVNEFKCPVCNHNNCLTCKAIHESMNCKEYQNQLFAESTNKQAKKTRKLLKKLVKKKEAMHCPDCNIILMKKEGCDWLQCTMCQLEICWITQQRRWGPDGPGDISGGCGCRVDGKKCHPLCVNCH